MTKKLITGSNGSFINQPISNNLTIFAYILKCNKTVETALNQIKAKNYCQALNQYKGDLLFVGINYDKDSKEHSCKIERL